MWYRKIDTFTDSQRFSTCEVDHYAQYKRFDDDIFIILLSIDDMVVAGPGMNKITDMKGQFQEI